MQIVKPETVRPIEFIASRMRQMVRALAASTALLVASLAHAETYTYPGPMAVIPDGDGAGISVPITVSDFVGPITGISVAVNLQHVWSGDVVLRLRSPNGTTFDLVHEIGRPAPRPAGDSSDYNGTYTFVDENFVGAGNIWAAASADSTFAHIIPAGNYRTSGEGSDAATNLLAAFSGLDTAQINGEWTLIAIDDWLSDPGAINSVALTLVGGTPAASPPTATTGVTATAGDAQITVSFSAPASDGGSAITGYLASCVPQGGGAAITANGLLSPIMVTGLSNGTTYDCTVAASNAIGTGVASSTVSATPSAAPVTPVDSVAPAVTPVPTMSEWALIILGLLAAGFGARGLRRRS